MNLFSQLSGSTRAAVISSLLIGMTAVPAGAEIYRCAEGETTVFSDLPCAAGAAKYDTEKRISVISAVDDLDEIAAENKAFLEQRKKSLARQREAAAEQRRAAERQRRRLEAIEQAQRYRTVVGRHGNSHFGNFRNTPADPRRQNNRRRAEPEDGPARRRTLLSRSGGNQRNILR